MQFKRKIKIESFIENLSDDGLTEDSEKLESIAIATVTESDAETEITYGEVSDGVRCDSKITVSDGGIRVLRRGGIDSEFIFSEGEKTYSLYKVPPYEFDAEIYTKKIRNSLIRGEGELTVFYEMTVGGATKKIKMRFTLSGGGAK